MDQYDIQIAELIQNPTAILGHWQSARGLFKQTQFGHPRSGCLTLIRLGGLYHKAIIKGIIDDKLTEQIASDQRLPINGQDIRVEHLPVFAEWQRKIDKLQSS